MSELCLSRRAALRLIGSAAGIALLAACAPAPQAAAPTAAPTTPAVSASTPTPVAAAASQPRRGGVARYSIQADLSSIDGHVRTPGAVDSLWLVFDRLTSYDDKLVPQPMLAESWDLSPDYKQVTFKLRKNVTFHSGREFTSDDVKWNLLRVRRPDAASGQYAAQSNWFSSIDTPDKYTVVLKSDNSRPALFDLFENLNMLDQESIDIEAGPKQTKAIGTGPFVFKEWVQGDHLTFDRNPNYWQNGKPYLDGLQANVRDIQSATLQLEAGALDLIRNPLVDDTARLEQDPKFAKVLHPNPGTFFEYGLDCSKPPLDNKLVRQALNYALNRERLVSLYRGNVTVGALPWGPSSPAFDETKNKSYAFDLDKAKSLLQQAGVSGLQLDNIIIKGSYPVQETFLQVYQADLASIGVTMTPKLVDAATWLDQANNVKYTGMWASGDNYANLNPGSLFAVSPGWRVFPNNDGFNDPRWAELVASANSEVDPARQKQLFSDINDYVLDQCFTYAVSNNPVWWITTSKFHGLTPTLHQGFLWTDAYLDG
ncbi:MAG: ABC transporter substrate-binding protein [Chloroflexi bacterium]|nr:ABC transporter substrate-binding protein [Chloroflexota bacterium]MBV9896907.1 ABC transporter substrate-binding protein [Chloroflexota bacterium]